MKKHIERRWIMASMLCLGLLSLTVTVAMATTASGSLSVSATVGAACSVGTSTLAFGSYTGSQVTGSGTVSVTCASGLPYTVDIGNGANAVASQRRMSYTPMGGMPSYLTYDLASDAGFMSPWGTGVTGGAVVNGNGSGSAQNITVYGRIPVQVSPPPAGSYTDNPSITVTF